MASSRLKKKEAEEKLQAKRDAEQNLTNNAPIVNNIGSDNQSGGWYFGNPVAMSTGFSSFANIWGDRKLEDNWRRKDKQSASFENTSEDDDEASFQGDSIVLKGRDHYLKDLPFSKKSQKEANDLVADGLFNLGTIYKDKLGDNPKAIEMFEELIRRYPKNENRLVALYQLYLLHKSADNYDRSDKFKNAILKEFPNSEYAKIIKNPNYLREASKQGKEVEKYYTITYEAYLKGNYQMVKNRKQISDSLFKDNTYAAKFDYLSVLATGKMVPVDTFQMVLEGFIKRHPKGDEKDAAQNILDYITKKDQVDSTKVRKVIYEYDPDAVNWYIMVIPDNIKADEIRVRISDFNKEFFGNDGLNVITRIFEEKTQIVIVKQFNGAKKGVNYLETITANEKVFKGYDKQKIFQFCITERNFPTFYSRKKTIEYIQFYERSYLVTEQ